MKPFKDVEATRRQYHAEGAVNSVHRSSLMVPELSGAVAEISFLNHFLIKRGHAPDGPACDLDVTFYDTSGEIAKRRWTLPAGGAFSCKLAEELAAEFGEPSPEEPSYIWYVIRGARADVTGYVVTRHGASGHCSGEHSF
ncbi:MAG: hypothetical protein V3U23_10015 [Kiloniellales bacterium]